jgi:hypothetical protein
LDHAWFVDAPNLVFWRERISPGYSPGIALLGTVLGVTGTVGCDARKTIAITGYPDIAPILKLMYSGQLIDPPGELEAKCGRERGIDCPGTPVASTTGSNCPGRLFALSNT